MKRNILLILFFKIIALMLSFTVLAETPVSLKIVTSDDPGSNANRSFIYVDNGVLLPQGIKRGIQKPPLRLQIPFVVDIPVGIKKEARVLWRVETDAHNLGAVELLSKFSFKRTKKKNGSIWQSELLSPGVNDRHRLVFRPLPLQHRPSIYKKGRGKKGKRRKYGGGTLKTDLKQFNPRLSYLITATVIDKDGTKQQFDGKIEMDNKDMIRQEYINHYGINRYGRGDNGNIPVPLRDEISLIPDMPLHLLGNGLSESRYGLMVNDGLSSLAVAIVNIYESEKLAVKKQPGLFQDLNKKNLPVPESELWLSGGWRNPERNEWYSNALNGIHQRGGAIDIVANEPHADKKSAIVYWFLWKALNKMKTLDAFWQLETHGRPMTTREFEEDIEPRNGIPDAFDKADHLHVNIKYPS